MRRVFFVVAAAFLCELYLPCATFAGVLNDVLEYQRHQDEQQNQNAQAFPNAVNAFIAGRQQAIANQQAMLALQIQMAEAEQARQNQIAAMRAEAERQKNAILQALSSPLKAQATLMEGVRLYIDSLSKNKTYSIFDRIFWANISSEMYQAEAFFKQSARDLNVYWVDASMTRQMKVGYLAAFQQFGSAIELEIQGFKNVLWFWIGEEQFERGRAAKVLALKNAMAALEDLRHTLALEIGVGLDSDLIRTLERDINTLNMLLEHWQKKTEQIATTPTDTSKSSEPAPDKTSRTATGTVKTPPAAGTPLFEYEVIVDDVLAGVTANYRFKTQYDLTSYEAEDAVRRLYPSRQDSVRLISMKTIPNANINNPETWETASKAPRYDKIDIGSQEILVLRQG